MENKRFQRFNLCCFPLASTERVRFSPASWCLCRIPEPQHRPGEHSRPRSACHCMMQYSSVVCFTAFTNVFFCPASSQCWTQSSTKWSRLCRTWRKRTLKTRCCSIRLTLVEKRCSFCPVRRRDLTPSSFCRFHVSVWSASPTCCQPSSCCAWGSRGNWWLWWTTCGWTRCCACSRLPTSPPRWTPSKRSPPQTQQCKRWKKPPKIWSILFLQMCLSLSANCLSGDKVDRGEHCVQDGEKCHWHGQAVGLAGGELGLINSTGG